MPVAPTYPGVYVEEIPSGVRTIVGVATSIAAFIDYFTRGPMNTAVQILNPGDFQREFGGLNARSEASYGIQQFFENGGTEAWVIRTASVPFANASVDIAAGINGGKVLTITAINPGTWGDTIHAAVDYDTIAAGLFNLTIAEYTLVGGSSKVVRQELFRNLSMNAAAVTFVEKVVNDPNTGSKLVNVDATAASLPLATGTTSGVLPATFTATAASHTVTVAIGVGTPVPASLAGPFPMPLTPLALAPRLEAAIRAAAPTNPGLAGATVSVVGNRLHVRAGGSQPLLPIVFGTSGADTTADDLGLIPAEATANLQEYVLGEGTEAGTAQVGGIAGNDGTPPNKTELVAAIEVLEEVDLFNLLCIPRTAKLTGVDALLPSDAGTVISVAETYCEKRRAMFLMDTPDNVDEPVEIKNWLLTNGSLRRRNAALYFPRVRVPDPLDNGHLRSIGASGTIAGLCARIDAARGVWKAPAGIEAVLRGVTELDDVLTDQQNGILNPLAINCLRTFPLYGTICWGARTLEGADQLASEWKYLPVRRLALFLEETLYRALKWVVFEPNDEPLWSQIRLNVGAFMQNLFRQGAFQGQTPRDAYFVKCDKETTTQNDINLGIVNIVVGFAPLKPAEFVIIKIQQMAGQVQT